MKSALFALMAGVAIVALSGCAHNNCCSNCPTDDDTHYCARPLRGLLGWGQGTCRTCPETAAACPTDPQPLCHGCGGRGCGLCMGHHVMPDGPVGPVTYPYYTLRGPRDFLARNPASIGP